ncbi:MAG: acyl-CoA dehydrogenase, partial [Pseudomonadota bacterium]
SSVQLLQELMAGKLQGAFAHTEAVSLGSEPALLTRAEKQGNAYKLNGRKVVVHNLGSADVMVVTAKLSHDELALFLLRPDDKGVSLRTYPTIDGRTAGDISLKNVEVDESRLLFVGEAAETVLRQVQADAMLAMSADMVGSMNTLLERTVNYTKERRQFNSRLVDFQVLRHRMVDMFVATELATSLLYAAAMKVRDGAPDAYQIAAAAKAKADKSAKMVAHSAIQLHGGIATTDELPIGHHLKRITVHEQRLGNTRTQLHRFQTPPVPKAATTVAAMKVA